MSMRENLARAGVGLVATGMFAAGCTPGERPAPQEVPSTAHSSPVAPPEFDFPRTPAKGSGAYAYCADSPHSWATHIDAYPDTVPTGDYRSTVAAAEGDISDTRLIAGATIRALGNSVYQIATSTGEKSVADLNTESYARVLPGTPNYSVAFTARRGSDGNAYFAVNCLPNFDYFGRKEAVPLDRLPMRPTSPPSASPVPGIVPSTSPLLGA